MASLNDQQQLSETHKEDDEELFMQAFHLARSSVLPMVLGTAVELGLVEIMAKSNNNQPLSASEIASEISTQNHDAPVIVERILRFLASYSILKCSLVNDKDGNSCCLYSLAPVCKYLTPDDDGLSIASSLAYMQCKNVIDCWFHFKDAVVDGGTPFQKANGLHVFGYDEKAVTAFHENMSNLTTLIMKQILEKYNGFESLREIVDVAGGFGASLRLIISKYPHVKGINFDLPSVVKLAPSVPGVHHAAGDMFINVPQGEAIFLKWVLHDWDDEKCLTILKNCHNALPTHGKVIVVEQIAPEIPESDIASKNVFGCDLYMFLLTPGGKERTKKEYEALATNAGFGCVKFVSHACGFHVIEFYK